MSWGRWPGACGAASRGCPRVLRPFRCSSCAVCVSVPPHLPPLFFPFLALFFSYELHSTLGTQLCVYFTVHALPHSIATPCGAHGSRGPLQVLFATAKMGPGPIMGGIPAWVMCPGHLSARDVCICLIGAPLVPCCLFRLHYTAWQLSRFQAIAVYSSDGSSLCTYGTYST